MTNTDQPGDLGEPGGRPSTSKPDGLELLKRFGPSLVLLILLVWFVLANSQEVEVNFFFVTAQAPLIVVLIATALVGALITILLQRRRRPT